MREEEAPGPCRRFRRLSRAPREIARFRGVRRRPAARADEVARTFRFWTLRLLSWPGVGELLYLSRQDVERLLDVDAMLDALGKVLIAFSAGVAIVAPRGGVRAAPP